MEIWVCSDDECIHTMLCWLWFIVIVSSFSDFRSSHVVDFWFDLMSYLVSGDFDVISQVGPICVWLWSVFWLWVIPCRSFCLLLIDDLCVVILSVFCDFIPYQVRTSSTVIYYYFFSSFFYPFPLLFYPFYRLYVIFSETYWICTEIEINIILVSSFTYI